jgi:hypothetical protein
VLLSVRAYFPYILIFFTTGSPKSCRMISQIWIGVGASKRHFVRILMVRTWVGIWTTLDSRTFFWKWSLRMPFWNYLIQVFILVCPNVYLPSCWNPPYEQKSIPTPFISFFCQNSLNSSSLRKQQHSCAFRK